MGVVFGCRGGLALRQGPGKLKRYLVIRHFKPRRRLNQPRTDTYLSNHSFSSLRQSPPFTHFHQTVKVTLACMDYMLLQGPPFCHF